MSTPTPARATPVATPEIPEAPYSSAVARSPGRVDDARVKTELSIDIVSDVVCPWCYIGERRLALALAARPEVTARIAWHPFLLDPGTPDEGYDLRAHLRRKYGADPESMFGRVELAARASGLALDFAKVRRMPATVRAHTLLRLAAAKGTQHALSRALFDANFVDGRDVGDVDTLASIAEGHGFTRDEALAALTDPGALEVTRAEARNAASQGISGVPFFVFDDRLALSGAQPVEVFTKAIDRALEA